MLLLERRSRRCRLLIGWIAGPRLRSLIFLMGPFGLVVIFVFYPDPNDSMRYLLLGEALVALGWIAARRVYTTSKKKTD